MLMVCIRWQCLERQSRFNWIAMMPRHRLCENAGMARHLFWMQEEVAHDGEARFAVDPGESESPQIGGDPDDAR